MKKLIYSFLVEFAVISLVNGQVVFQPYSDEAVDALLKEEAANAEAPATTTASS